MTIKPWHSYSSKVTFILALALLLAMSSLQAYAQSAVAPTLFITGSNRGIGFELVKQYAEQGWRVIATARNPESADELNAIAKANPNVVVEQLDVTDFDRVDELANKYKDRPIDVLINNAGILGKYTMDEGAIEYSAFGNFDAEEWMNVYRINVMAPMKIAEAFVEHVAASDQKKIITISSEIGSIANNEFGRFYPYRASKAAVNAIMKSMSIDLAEREIIAVPLHPGWVRTDMGGQDASIGVVESVTKLRGVIANLTSAQSGHFLTYDGGEMPW